MSDGVDALVTRINSLADRITGNDKVKQALTLIGIRLQAEIKKKIRSIHLIDTGNLQNKIYYKLFQDDRGHGVAVGSYGVPYAALYEFGFHGSQNVRAHSRLMNEAFGKPVKTAKQIQVKAHVRFLTVAKRPYIRPTVLAENQYILDTIRAVLNE